MGSSSSKQGKLEPERQQLIPPLRAASLPREPEYHAPPPAHEIIDQILRTPRRGVVCPSKTPFTPNPGGPFAPPRPNRDPYGHRYNSDEDKERIRFVSWMSLADSLPNPPAQPPRPRALQPTLSTPREMRARASQPNFSCPREVQMTFPPPSPPAPQRRSRASYSNPSSFGDTLPLNALYTPPPPPQPRPRASHSNLPRPRDTQPVTPPCIPPQPRPRASHSDLNTNPRRQARQRVSASDLNALREREPRQRASQPDLTTPPHQRIVRAIAGSGAYDNLVRSRTRSNRPTPIHEEPSPSPAVLTQECTICIEDKPLKDFLKVTSRCRHQSTVCLTCVRTWIKSELSALTWDKIKCMEGKCRGVLCHADMKRLATWDVFEKYDQFATLSALSSMPNFRWCLSTKCKSGQLHTTGTHGPIFRCQACGFKVCIIHNVPFHTGLTCREYDYSKNPKLKKKEEEASEKLVRVIARRCPGRGCAAPIERSGGCDHMTCSKCKHQFCWLCFADHAAIRKNGNTAHKSTCRLHSNNLSG